MLNSGTFGKPPPPFTCNLPIPYQYHVFHFSPHIKRPRMGCKLAVSDFYFAANQLAVTCQHNDADTVMMYDVFKERTRRVFSQFCSSARKYLSTALLTFII